MLSIALAQAARKGSVELDKFLAQTSVALVQLGYETLYQAYLDGIITASEYDILMKQGEK